MLIGMGVPYRVLVADDDPMVREAYRVFLTRNANFEIVAEAGDGEDAVEAYDRFLPDIVLMDLQMPRRSGVDAIQTICTRHPGACVLALTTFASRDHITAALRAGAGGYLVKDAGGAALLVAIEQAIAGEMPLSPSVRRELVADLRTTDDPPATAAVDHGLTGRETELVGWLAKGMTNQQIAEKMFLSEGSVKQYLSHIGDKLGSRSRTQILVRSIRLGIVGLADIDMSAD